MNLKLGSDSQISNKNVENITQKFKRICKSNYYLDRFRKLPFKVLNGTFYEGVELDPTTSKFTDIFIQVVEKERFSDRLSLDFNFSSELDILRNLPPNKFVHTIKDYRNSVTNYYLIYDQLKTYDFLATYTDNQSKNYKYFPEEEIFSIQDQVFQGLNFLESQKILNQLVLTQHILYSQFQKQVKLLAPCFMISNINNKNQFTISYIPDNSPLKKQQPEQQQQQNKRLLRQKSVLDINNIGLIQQKELNEYIPPEVYNSLLKQEKCIHYNDQHYSWSYGIFLYKLAYGRIPFEDMDQDKVNSMPSINFSQKLQSNIKFHEKALAMLTDQYKYSPKIEETIERFLKVVPNQRPEFFPFIKSSIILINSADNEKNVSIIDKNNNRNQKIMSTYNANKPIQEVEDENKSNMEYLNQSQDMLGNNIIESQYQRQDYSNIDESNVQSMLKTNSNNQYSYLNRQSIQQQFQSDSNKQQQQSQQQKSQLGSEIMKLGAEFTPYQNAEIFDLQFSQSINIEEQNNNKKQIHFSDENLIVQKYYQQLYFQEKIIEFLKKLLPELENLKQSEEFAVDIDKAQLALLKYGILKYKEMIKKLENKDKNILKFEREADCQLFYSDAEYVSIKTKFQFNSNNLIKQYEEKFDKLNNENLLRSSKITSDLYNENAILYFLSKDYNQQLDKIKYPYRQCIFKIEKKFDESSCSLLKSSFNESFQNQNESILYTNQAKNIMEICYKLTHSLIPSKIFVYPTDFEQFYKQISQKDYKTLKQEKDQLMTVFFPKYSQALSKYGLISNINQ